MSPEIEVEEESRNVEQGSDGSFRGPGVHQAGLGLLAVQKAVVEVEGVGILTEPMKKKVTEALEVQSKKGPPQVWLSSRRVHPPSRLGVPWLSDIPQCYGT